MAVHLKFGRPSLQPYRRMFDLPPAADGGCSVTFAGVSTLLFDDGESAILFNGFFSRPSLAAVALGKIAPNRQRISNALDRLGLGGQGPAAVVPVHTHFDHALDSAHIAARTGATLVGGESVANIGCGAGLSEDRIHVVGHATTVTFGKWTLRFAESEHCPPDRFPGAITEPLVPPARASAYRCGEAWSVLIEHVSGRSALVQGSAGFVPGALDGWSADRAYLGVGMLGHRPHEYITDYWTHTVRAVGAGHVVLTHWDDFFRSLDRPLRATAYVGDDLDATMRVLGKLSADDAVPLHFPRVWEREDPWALSLPT